MAQDLSRMNQRLNLVEHEENEDEERKDDS